MVMIYNYSWIYPNPKFEDCWPVVLLLRCGDELDFCNTTEPR